MQSNNLEDKGWDAMSQLLDQEMPEKKERKGIFIWWFWGIISFVGLLVVGTLVYHNKDGQSQQVIQGKEYVASSLVKDRISQSLNTNNYGTTNNLEANNTLLIHEDADHTNEEKIEISDSAKTTYKRIQKKENVSFASNLNQNTSSHVLYIDNSRKEELTNQMENEVKNETNKDFSGFNNILATNSTKIASPSLTVDHDRVEHSVSMLELPSNLNSLQCELKENNTTYSLSVTENKTWLLNSEINLMSSYSSAVKSVGFGMESLISIKHVNTSWILLSGIGFHRFNSINLEEVEYDLKNESTDINNVFTGSNTVSSRDYLMIPLLVAYERSRLRLAAGIRYAVDLESPNKIGEKHILFLTSQLNYRFSKRFSIFAGYDYDVYKAENEKVISPKNYRADNLYKLHSIKTGVSFRF